jgi:hypothetical protein
MKMLADKINSFNQQLDFTGALPPGIRIMNPFKENEEALRVSTAFYKKFYNDQLERRLILGINPGRFGAGVTGVPFTDPKRLEMDCGISFRGKQTHEPSSVFMYEMINAYGGVKAFYKGFYIGAVCPLGFTSVNAKGREVNYNYYDSKELMAAVYDFMVHSIKTQLNFSMRRDTCFCLGTGKNEHFLRTLNEEHQFFDNIIAVEHPRFVMQYRSATKQNYINKYLAAFRS